MNPLAFTKWNGLGNDFILIESSEADAIRPFTAALCNRHCGIGADGVVVLQQTSPRDVAMRIFNSDGSEAEMCGNASRCVGAHFRKRHSNANNNYTLHTLAGPIGIVVREDGLVQVDMGKPRLTRQEIPVAGPPQERALDIEIPIGDRILHGTAVSMGNPHVVVFVEDISKTPVAEWGALIERLPLFPERANVEFAQALAGDRIRMRVWERGCGITMACGTGSCATVVAGVLIGKTSRHASVYLDGGTLEIEYSAEGRVFMTGPATLVFQGTIDLKTFSSNTPSL